MKKADRIETTLGESNYHECVRGYIQLVTAGRKLDPSRKPAPLKPRKSDTTASLSIPTQSQKRVDYPDAAVLLAVVQILRKKLAGTAGLSSSEDHRIPQRDLPPDLEREAETEK